VKNDILLKKYLIIINELSLVKIKIRDGLEYFIHMIWNEIKNQNDFIKMINLIENESIIKIE
jgi:hypothetical protein